MLEGFGFVVIVASVDKMPEDSSGISNVRNGGERGGHEAVGIGDSGGCGEGVGFSEEELVDISVELSEGVCGWCSCCSVCW